MSKALLVYIYTVPTHDSYADNYALHTWVGTLRVGGSRAELYLYAAQITSYNQCYVNKRCYTLGDGALVSFLSYTHEDCL